MRTLIKGFIVIFVAVFMISMNSCEELEDIIPLPSMTANVDGVEWTSQVRLSVFNESATIQSIVITGAPGLSESVENVDKAIILTIMGAGEGTYNLDLTAQECMVAYKKTADAVEGGDNYYVATDATITISSMDMEKKQISGTFSATLNSTNNLLDVMEITDGVFKNLNYQVK